MSQFATRGRFLIIALVAAIVAWSLPAGAASAWSIVPSPNPGTANSINALAALSPTEVWGIGSVSSSSYSGCKGRTLATRWNGSAFVEVIPATPTPLCAAINGAAGSSISDLWAVGSTNNARDVHIRHWDGAMWSTVTGATIPGPSIGRRQRSTMLNAVTTLSSTNAWTVGTAVYPDFSNNNVVEHWDGSSWTLVPAMGPTGSRLTGVAAVNANDIWAVGSGGFSDTAALATLIMHWNGTAFAKVASPNSNRLNFLSGVSAASSKDVWAVGNSVKDPNDGVSVTRTLIQHWNGSAWLTIPSPNVGAGNNSLAAVVARSATDAWAVGFYDAISGDFLTRHTLALHWNGAAWSVSTTPNSGTGDNWLTSVVAPTGSTQVFASGNSANGTLVELFAG